TVYGVQTVFTGGIVSGALLVASSVVIPPSHFPQPTFGSQVLSGGTAMDTLISSGTQSVLSGALASGTVLNFGGSETVSSCVTASGTVINFGGILSLASGALDIGTIVAGGGTENVGAGV